MEEEKQKFVDKIAEINARIVDIRKELAGHTDDDAPLFECVVDKVEQEEYVLSVKDDELTSERWLSPEERRRGGGCGGGGARAHPREGRARRRRGTALRA